MPLFLRRLLHVFRPGASGPAPGDPLHAFRGEWTAARRRAAPVLGEAWERQVMRAVRLAAVEEPAVPDWLAQRLQPLALTNAVIVLLALALFWQAGDPASALADYTQSALAAYEVIF